VANRSQKYMHADCDYQANQREQADGYDENAEASYVAAGDRLHGGTAYLIQARRETSPVRVTLERPIHTKVREFPHSALPFLNRSR
jgi:hypothetical protein